MEEKEGYNEYRIAMGLTTDKLSEQVNYFLRKGWKLEGGVAFSSIGLPGLLQALSRPYDPKRIEREKAEALEAKQNKKKGGFFGF